MLGHTHNDRVKGKLPIHAAVALVLSLEYMYNTIVSHTMCYTTTE